MSCYGLFSLDTSKKSKVNIKKPWMAGGREKPPQIAAVLFTTPPQGMQQVVYGAGTGSNKKLKYSRPCTISPSLLSLAQKKNWQMFLR